MQRYLLDIKADDKPVLLERVLRVTRHRGFVIKQVAATQNHESKIASVEIIVDSDRPITTLTNQIEKLWMCVLWKSQRSEMTSCPITTYNKRFAHKEGNHGNKNC